MTETNVVELDTSTCVRMIHHRHYHEFGRTLAISAPTRKELVAASNLLRKGKDAKITLFIGVARLHPKDQYCKKTGRETASQNLTPHEATINAVYYDSVGTRYAVTAMNHSMEFYRRHGKNTATLHNVRETDAL